MSSKIILISGPTASGKSYLAIKIAKKLDGEIINADSMQVYKELSTLTARPLKNDQKNIKHHLYGFINLNKKFSTGHWLKKAIIKIKEIKNRKKIPILVGGTGLYFQALTKGLVKIPNIPIKFRNRIRLIQKKEGQKNFYKKLIKLDPKVKNKFDKNDVQRSIRAYEIKKYTSISMYQWITKTKPVFDQNSFLKLYLNIERENLLKRIEKRTFSIINKQAIKEVKKILKLKIKKNHSILKVIGFNELSRYLNNEIDLAEAKRLIIIKTRQYAKRQTTWARSRMNDWTMIDQDSFSKIIKT
tara:strand:+ start:2692 stop:3591 length:900 start_codon:yes stop_codon:yes gene_type:complete